MSNVIRTTEVSTPTTDKKGNKISSRGTVDVERIPEKVDKALLEQTKKSRFIKIIIFAILDLLLAGFLIYQVVTIFKTIFEQLG